MESLLALRAQRFFFSSRRRHTSYWRDWSSDVCSSDLVTIFDHPGNSPRARWHVRAYGLFAANPFGLKVFTGDKSRSEERRVGKECRCRWGEENEKKEDEKET